MPTPIQTPRAIVSGRGRGRCGRGSTAAPIDADREHRRRDPRDAAGRSGASRRWPSPRRRERSGRSTTTASAASRNRSVSTAAAATAARTRPKAWLTRPTKPPGMNTAQLSMSIARTKAASTTAASTNHPAAGPSTALRDPGDEERRHAELRERQRRRLPHRHERQQRRRRQDDAHAASWTDQRGQGHGVSRRGRPPECVSGNEQTMQVMTRVRMTLQR